MTTEEEKKTDEKKVEDKVEDKEEVVVYNDALSALEKKAGPENAKEIQALVSLIEEELSASNEDLNGLAEDISNNTISTAAKQKQMFNGVLGATILHDPEQAHKEARDTAYEMLTGKKNKKKMGILQEFKELISDGGIMLAAKNLLKKAMGNDLKAEAQKKKTLMDEFVKNNTEMLNNLKKKLNLPLIAATIVDIDKKTDTLPTDNHDHEDAPSGNLDVNESEFKFSVPIGSPLGDKNIHITSHKGPRNVKNNPLASKNHQGVDLRAAIGTDIVTPADGKVIKVGFQGTGAGNYVDIDHGKFITRYFHLSKVIDNVKEGTIVKANQKIAESGATGNATVNGTPHPHLHYEIRDKSEIVKADGLGAGKYKALDPEDFIDVDGDGKVTAMTTYKDQLAA